MSDTDEPDKADPQDEDNTVIDDRERRHQEQEAQEKSRVKAIARLPEAMKGGFGSSSQPNASKVQGGRQPIDPLENVPRRSRYTGGISPPPLDWHNRCHNRGRTCLDPGSACSCQKRSARFWKQLPRATKEEDQAFPQRQAGY